MRSKNLFIAILLMLILSSCSGENCIEADDFGHSNITISPRYSKDAMNGQVGENQIGPWVDSNFRVNGRPLTILVKDWDYLIDRNTSSELSAWCPWFGTAADAPKLSEFCRRLPDCAFLGNKMCTNTIDAKIMNAPCIFRKGIGLYTLISEKNTDPNQTLESQRDPVGISFHLGEVMPGYSMYEIDKKGKTRLAGGRVYQFDPAARANYGDNKLYFKILDKFYDDNNGQYKVVIKSGISLTSPDPISVVTSLVRGFLFGADGDYGLIRGIYMGLVNNPAYKIAISAMLTLYISFTALSYLSGNLQITHTELIVRVTKIAIVSALLSSKHSWSFFNDYLFVYFIGGVEQILQMIIDAGATGPGSPSIVALMIAPQTIAKLLSLIFIDWMGWIYVLLFIIVLYFILRVFFHAAVIYLTALMAIGMIIIMGPIFISFMLFGITRSLFENWLKQLISYAVQPIILFTGLIFISMILRQEIYGSLGFRVCKQDFPVIPGINRINMYAKVAQEITGIDLGGSIFYWWFPQPMKGEQFSKTLVKIPIPLDHFTDDNLAGGKGTNSSFCEAYGCVGDRYIDLPFLDPAKDTRRLNQFWNGKFVQFDGLILIFVAIYLLYRFNKLTVSIAKFITNTTGNFTNISSVGNSVRSQTFDKANSFIKTESKRIANKVIDRTIDTTIGRDKWEKFKQSINPSAIVDKARIRSLKAEALSPSANKSILEEVAKNTSLSQKDIVPNAKEDYRAALKEQLLNNIDSTLPQSKREKIAAQTAKTLSKKDYADLKNEFAKAQFGIEYDKLKTDDKKKIDKIHSDINLRKLAKNHSQNVKFQEAYVDAYIAMSDRGIGLVGKNVKSIRSLEEIKHEADQRKALKVDKQTLFGQELVSKIEGAAHSAAEEVGLGRLGAGTAWHDINNNQSGENFTKKTYAENLADQKRIIAYESVASKIKDYNKAERKNIISPEFLAEASKLGNSNIEYYRELNRQELSQKVYSELSSGEDPALMGKTYMEKYAKDSEMSHMIDRAYEIEKDLHKNDQFVSRKDDYETTFDVAAEKIVSVHKELKKYYERDDIRPEELPSLLEKYYSDSKIDINKDEAASEVSELKGAIEDFDSSQRILQEIDNRKIEIANVVDGHVKDINEYRKKADMKPHQPPRETSNVRKLRKIEDLIRK